MKNIFLIIAFLFTSEFIAQEAQKGNISGKVFEEEIGANALPFANIILEGTSTGTISEIDGSYSIENVDSGTYTLVISFLGFETEKIEAVEVTPGKTTEINAALETNAASLDEVVIQSAAREDSEIASLLRQKEAMIIRESIGGRKMSKMGVSDAAGATTKISGVSGSEATGDIFIRGLGDRYFSTTLNGLPIPSDDVNKKNINLELFPSEIVQSISISKTYSPENSADQASGTVNISPRELIGTEELSFEIEAGINTGIPEGEVLNSFKLTSNSEDVHFGFSSSNLDLREAFFEQSWSPKTTNFPLNREFSITAGKKISDQFEFLFTGSQSVSFEYQTGLYKGYRANFLTTSFQDTETFSKTVNTTGLIDLSYSLDNENILKSTHLFINKLNSEVYEAGRDGTGFVFEETSPKEGLSQFVRDQKLQQTRLIINQLLGFHEISDQHQFNWAAGLNLISAYEPIRIRNEVNFNEEFVQLGRTGGFQQRKSEQKIEEIEFNAAINDDFSVSEVVKFSAGADFRSRERDFYSKFIGLEEKEPNLFSPASVDGLSAIFTQENFEKGNILLNILPADTYTGKLTSGAGYFSGNFETGKWNLNAGLRYQYDELKVAYNVGNISGRTGRSEKKYSSFYPAVNIKYQLKPDINLRFSSSKTITLPEFKEVAPFEYVSQTGEVTRGNPQLSASTNYNFDLKWEYFPTTSELLSLTAFYKKIKNPINKVRDRGSAGVFSYFNSAEEVNIFGLEFEANLDLLKNEDPNNIDLALNMNVTRMWHSQDLKEIIDEEGNLVKTYRYNGLTEVGLPGASDWIANAMLYFSTDTENAFSASLVGNYASDKIFALGAPEIQTAGDEYFNAAIIEKGFIQVDAILKKEFGRSWEVKLSGKNLLDPQIKRTQLIQPGTTNIETEEVIRSYSRGAEISLGLSYTF